MWVSTVVLNQCHPQTLIISCQPACLCTLWAPCSLHWSCAVHCMLRRKQSGHTKFESASWMDTMHCNDSVQAYWPQCTSKRAIHIASFCKRLALTSSLDVGAEQFPCLRVHRKRNQVYLVMGVTNFHRRAYFLTQCAAKRAGRFIQSRYPQLQSRSMIDAAYSRDSNQTCTVSGCHKVNHMNFEFLLLMS